MATGNGQAGERRRRAALRAAIASNRLEGQEPDPSFADIHEARAAGEIGHEEALHEMERRILGARPEPGW